LPKKGSVLEQLTVTDAGAKGKNIARAGSFVVLVEGAVPGDVVDVEILRKKKGFAEGRAVNFHEYSKDRLIPVCPHFYNCGGCSWQNMTYAQQLHFKQKMVADTLQRIAKIPLPEISLILGSARTEYYRNRLDLAFSNKKWLTREEMQIRVGFDEPGIGFHVSGRFDKVLDISRCYLQPQPSNQIRQWAYMYATENAYPFFDIRDQHGSLRSLIVRTTAVTGELMVIMIFYKETQERIEQFMQAMHQRFPQISSLYYVENPKANDTVYDLEHKLFYGKPYMVEEINGVKFRIGPKSFFQTNPFQAPVLFAEAIKLAELKNTDVVYDLYTGVGSIALSIAKNVKKVVGVEAVEEAIDFAKLNATDNNITNADFFAGDVKDILTDEFIAEHGKPDVLITDPPRAGMEPPVIAKILELAPPKIVYVSCNPSTQARDLELMKDLYDVVAVQPVDMFPHTYHVENIALLIKK
jgi:23S rRNA (uracil1939-C5)-methyltransferase